MLLNERFVQEFVEMRECRDRARCECTDVTFSVGGDSATVERCIGDEVSMRALLGGKPGGRGPERKNGRNGSGLG